eukprot:SAG31_NODE_1112_length_9855_cov_13.754203_8_plen_63_part_00
MAMMVTARWRLSAAVAGCHGFGPRRHERQQGQHEGQLDHAHDVVLLQLARWQPRAGMHYILI